LLDNRIDIAVHSAKDLPSAMIPELRLAAVPERESPHDVWISRDGLPYDQIKTGTAVGTGSPRRRAQVLSRHGGADVRGIRGNVETRLRKLETGDYDGLIMAHAGLKRSGLVEAVTEVLAFEKMLPAPGQGALAIQTRAADERAIAVAATLDHSVSHRMLDIERALMARLGAGCSTPLGGIARVVSDRVMLQVVLLDDDGKRRLDAEHAVAADGDDAALVSAVVDQLLTRGARELIDHG
jgi:hydroxymethylbilane synthase